jgi:WD40 repeat protein
LTTATDGSIRLWKADEEYPLNRALHECDDMSAVRLSPDNSQILSAGCKSIKLWRTDDLSAVTSFPIAAMILAASWGVDGKSIVVLTDEAFLILDAKTGQARCQLSLDNHDYFFVRNRRADEEVYLPNTSGELLRVSNCKEAERIVLNALSRKARYVLGVLSENNQIGIAIDDLGSVAKWQPVPFQAQQGTKLHEGILALAISPSGEQFAVAVGLSIYVYNSADYKLIAQLRGHTASVYTLKFDSTGETLFSAGEDQVVNVWNFRSAKMIGAYPIPSWDIAEIEILSKAHTIQKIFVLDSDGRILDTHFSIQDDILEAKKRLSN